MQIRFRATAVGVGTPARFPSRLVTGNPANDRTQSAADTQLRLGLTYGRAAQGIDYEALTADATSDLSLGLASAVSPSVSTACAER